jgi:HEPN domain-containing protein
MRHRHPDSEVESYIRKAERDLATAVRMAREGPDFADIVCFHAAQCAEKSLKGLILALGEVPPRTHDLTVLQKALVRLDASSKRLEEFCLALTDYAVAPRYPGWEDLAGEIEIDCVLESSKSVLDHVIARLELTNIPDA